MDEMEWKERLGCGVFFFSFLLSPEHGLQAVLSAAGSAVTEREGEAAARRYPRLVPLLIFFRSRYNRPSNQRARGSLKPWLSRDRVGLGRRLCPHLSLLKPAR